MIDVTFGALAGKTPGFSGRKWSLALLVTLAATGSLISAVPAIATVAWSVHSFSDPTRFAPSDEERCSQQERCDRYTVVIQNVGDTASSGTTPIKLKDMLPAGITTTGKEGPGQIVQGSAEGLGASWECAAPATAEEQVGVVECSNSEPEVRHVAPGSYVTATLEIPTTAPSPETAIVRHAECILKHVVVESGKCIEKNTVEVTGGGAQATAQTSNETVVSPEAPPFELTSFGVDALNADGTTGSLAGSHPNNVTASFELSSIFQPNGVERESSTQAEPVENPRAVVLELPAGFFGDPQAIPTCPEVDLLSGKTQGSEEARSACPPASRVGVIAFDGEGNVHVSNAETGPTGVYNMQPQAGYPAEFAFAFAEKVITMYATVVRTPSGYRLRVSAPGLPEVAAIGGSITFFGDPAAANGTAGPHTALLTNSADCSAGPLSTKVEADSWENPARWVTAESETYPQITECNLLQFSPKLEMAPSPAAEEGTSQADEPSAYAVDLKVSQKELFEEGATPDLKDATVTLPEGVSVSLSAASGLVGCQEHGPDGIDIPESKSGHEAGEGERIEADGLPHMTAGNCPDASTLGTVEIKTPLLVAPLRGHVFLAAPKCGGEGQPACTEASVTNGELYGLYIEAEDHAAGVTVKIPGSVSADPATGRLTGKFTESPQLPFSELKLQFHGGPRALLANPQACGSFATSSTLTSWSGQEGSGPSPSFGVDWDGKGGACPASLPFAPGFSAGTTNPAVGAFSPFVLAFSRQDREQDLSGLSVTLPAGLLGKIAGVPLCGEEQANAGTCGPGSELGSATVLAGPGTHPFSLMGGRVYLTSGYKGQPFGLSVVIPAVAGPFKLGNVVVRASIHIDSKTGQVTVTSDPLPQFRDGVPFRLRTVIAEINRPGFMLNPTNCAQQQVAGVISGGEGASAPVSNRFQAANCATLPFKPKLTALTRANGEFAGHGASLHLAIVSATGEANMRSLKLDLPQRLPARLETIQQACPQRVFNLNPAACPRASVIGSATVATPLLDQAMRGPAILVSHGGAAFPDMVLVLQAQGVRIDLTGALFVDRKNITSATFRTIPDVPIRRLDLVLPEGKSSVLAAGASLCAKKRMNISTAIIGQNGARVKPTVKVAVAGCKPKKKRHPARRKAKKKHHSTRR